MGNALDFLKAVEEKEKLPKRIETTEEVKITICPDATCTEHIATAGMNSS